MALINLLRHSTKQTKPAKSEKIKVSLKLPKTKTLLVIPALIILLLFIVWIGLFMQIKSKEKTLVLLDKKLLNIKSSYQEIESLNKNKKELEQKLLFYQGLLENSLIWSERLSAVAGSVPAQVWLTSIYTESKPARILVIKGSATSLVESEIIASISQFVERLKKQTLFFKDFSEIKLGPILSEKKGNLSVMSFSLFCKFK